MISRSRSTIKLITVKSSNISLLQKWYIGWHLDPGERYRPSWASCLCIIRRDSWTKLTDKDNIVINYSFKSFVCNFLGYSIYVFKNYPHSKVCNLFVACKQVCTKNVLTYISYLTSWYEESLLWPTFIDFILRERFGYHLHDIIILR